MIFLLSFYREKKKGAYLQEEIDHLKNSQQSLSKSSEENTYNNQDIYNEMNRLRHQLEASRNSYRSEEAARSEEKIAYEAKINELKQVIEESKRNSNSNEDHYKNQLESMMKQSSNDTLKFQSELDKLNHTLKREKAQYDRCKDELDKLKISYNTLNSSKRSSQESEKELQSKLDLIQNKYNSEVSFLKSELESIKIELKK